MEYDSQQQVIPSPAVEAATDAMQQFALVEDRDGLQSWEAYARLALEAAIPVMVADGWVRRCKKGCACDCHNSRGPLVGHEMGHCTNG